MKIIAAAAVFLALTATAWADEQGKSQAGEPANSNEAIVLSESEMDGVTAGVDGIVGSKTWQRIQTTGDSAKIGMVFQSYALYPH